MNVCLLHISPLKAGPHKICLEEEIVMCIHNSFYGELTKTIFILMNFSLKKHLISSSVFDSLCNSNFWCNFFSATKCY